MSSPIEVFEHFVSLWSYDPEIEQQANEIRPHFKALEGLPTNKQFDEIAILCQNKAIACPTWNHIAGNIKMEGLKQNIPETFSGATKVLKPILHPDYYSFVEKNAEDLDCIVVNSADYKFDIFAVETLIKSYLGRLKNNKTQKILETPQYMYLRVATYLWYSHDDPSCLERIEKVYKDLMNGNYSHASPTFYNAGFSRPQLASCFTMDISDSMKGIADNWSQTAFISQNSGGIGVDYSSLRHSEIGQYGESKGVIPWIKVSDSIFSAVDQGGKRKGSGCAYLCDWHIDIEEFIELRKPNGPDELRARNIFLALMLSDEFMRRVEKNEEWTLFCPNKVPGLVKKWGLDFEMLYRGYEKKARDGSISDFRIVNARNLLRKIIQAQIETGLPFMLYKDAINRKTNQMNLGTIRLSNLCTEITLYTDKDNIGSCNLASVNLESCLQNIKYSKTPETDMVSKGFNFEKLERLVRELVKNINQVIDRNYYIEEIPQIKYTNLRNRPLGIGVMGLADVFAAVNINWESKEARELNFLIFETMYYAAVKESVEQAKKYGSYETFIGSPASQGLFQFDLWEREAKEYGIDNDTPRMSGRYDWESLRRDMKKYGLRNSLLLALMPTASTANILGVNECFEPFTQMIYTRTVLSGQFTLFNKYIFRDFDRFKISNRKELTLHIIQNNGSIANFNPPGLTKEQQEQLAFLKKKYKTVYEIPQKTLLNLALDRGRFVCQTQSFNCWMKDPTTSKLFAYHFHGWKNGAKTGMYYLRQPASVNPINFSVEKTSKTPVCDGEVCIACQ